MIDDDYDDDDYDWSDDDNQKSTETVDENNRENRYPVRQRRMPERYWNSCCNRLSRYFLLFLYL